MSKWFAHKPSNHPSIHPFNNKKKDLWHFLHHFRCDKRWENIYRLLVCFFSILLLLLPLQFGRSFFRLIWMVERSLDYFHKYFDYLNTIVSSICHWQTWQQQKEKNEEKNSIFFSLLRFVNNCHNFSTWWTWKFCIFREETACWNNKARNKNVVVVLPSRQRERESAPNKTRIFL